MRSFGHYAMHIVICPGIHDPELTQSFLMALLDQLDHQQRQSIELLVFPATIAPVYSGWHVLQFLRSQFLAKQQDDLRQIPFMFIGFSAGVVGAIGAAWAWQQWGGQVKALVALDGWGVPLSGDFPIHRLSHDYFTHWSAALLGSGQDRFYAEPAVEHLELWRSPHKAIGWWIPVDATQAPVQLTAAAFLAILIERYR